MGKEKGEGEEEEKGEDNGRGGEEKGQREGGSCEWVFMINCMCVCMFVYVCLYQ